MSFPRGLVGQKGITEWLAIILIYFHNSIDTEEMATDFISVLGPSMFDMMITYASSKVSSIRKYKMSLGKELLIRQIFHNFKK